MKAPDIIAELHDWRKHVCREDGTHVYWGHVYGDKAHRFPDGYWIHTAQIINRVGELVYTVTGSVYRLVGESGGPDVNPWSKK